MLWRPFNIFLLFLGLDLLFFLPPEAAAGTGPACTQGAKNVADGMESSAKTDKNAARQNFLMGILRYFR
jgi:hypothetical protein